MSMLDIKHHFTEDSFLASARTEMIDLLIGPDKKLFRKNEACSTTYPQIPPDLFDILIGWVYSNSIKKLGIIDSTDSKCIWHYNPIDFYFLARVLFAKDLMDAIMTELITFLKEYGTRLNENNLMEIYNLTSTRSPLKNFVLHNLVWRSLHNLQQDDDYQLVSPALVNNFLRAMRKSDQVGERLKIDLEIMLRGNEITVNDPTAEPVCNYH
ncbi:hypothetical protein G7Y89_g14138 [Cudoniella acicularis]|uniref:BTB domain-containing protein n=1 Tax=Cudoniella acicularis TaxID=354080 RepID=A0A8H4R871_9HELO|nr:hypothetical protein G7Y89_g14138 [Cudoniella acicularis]